MQDERKNSYGNGCFVVEFFGKGRLSLYLVFSMHAIPNLRQILGMFP